MRNFDIKTTIGISPISQKTLPGSYMTRGSQLTLQYDISQKGFTFEDIKQYTIMFKDPKTENIYYYEMYTNPAKKTMNEQFEHFVGTSAVDDTKLDYINFRLTPENTLDFNVTEDDNYIEVEVAVALLGVRNTSHTVLEKLTTVKVIDSIYAKILESQNA